MDMKAQIDNAMKLLNSGFPCTPVGTQKLMPHIETFVKEMNLDPALNGLVMQVAVAKPHLADNYVFTITIAGSIKDSQAAVDALSRMPDNA